MRKRCEAGERTLRGRRGFIRRGAWLGACAGLVLATVGCDVDGALVDGVYAGISDTVASVVMGILLGNG